MVAKVVVQIVCVVLLLVQFNVAHHRHHHQHHHHHLDHEHDHRKWLSNSTEDQLSGNDSAEDQLNNYTDSALQRENVIEQLDDENESDEFCEWYHCDKDLSQERGFSKYFDFRFVKKLVRNLNPFSSPRMRMNFYLFKLGFTECGRELKMDDDAETIHKSGFNASHPTRIIIHGWMSQSRGSFNRDVKNAYLSRGDFNIIVADWSSSASNLNYFSVVRMIDEFGSQVARFTLNLHETVQVDFDDIYLVGHSLGAQIAGAAGKRIKPYQFNTIFALDPAGPKFRLRSADVRIDPTDAKYVEAIQTSANLGLLEPTGNATFYPNYGFYQKKCFYVGCSHIRAYILFAESVRSDVGFWGMRCEREKLNARCKIMGTEQFQMGGEPSSPKNGSFYVETNDSTPFAIGRSNTTDPPATS